MSQEPTSSSLSSSSPPSLRPIEYATPQRSAASRALDRRVAVTLIVCGTLIIVSPWLLAIIAVVRGGNVSGDFWHEPFVWVNFFVGGLVMLLTIIKAPRSGDG
jgi:hypothetical protein